MHNILASSLVYIGDNKAINKAENKAERMVNHTTETKQFIISVPLLKISFICVS